MVYIFSRNSSVDFMKEGRNTLFNNFRGTAVINFGSRSAACFEACNKPNRVVINHPAFIQNASNKGTFSKIIRAFNEGVQVATDTQEAEVLMPIKIPVTYDFEELITPKGNVKLTFIREAMTFPIIVKPKRGSGGEGIVKFNDMDEFVEWRKGKSTGELLGYILQEVFQPDLSRNYEFRISVAPALSNTPIEYSAQNTNSKGVISLRRKFLTQRGIEAGKFGRNIEEGLSYFSVIPLTENTDYLQFPLNRRVSVNLQEAIHMCHSLVTLLQLDFGAVDILYDSERQEWAILEVNTAPSLSQSDSATVRTEWVNALRHLLQIKSR